MYTHFLKNKKIINHNKNLIDNVIKNYGFVDLSYGNDSCNSIGYILNDKEYFQIFIPNSNNENYDNEEFNKYLVCFESENYYHFEQFNLEVESIEDAVSIVLSNINIGG